MRSIGLAVLVSALWSYSMFAADRAEKSTLLSVDLSRGVITDVSRHEDSALVATNTFTIRRDETVSIEIAQQNPLLFVYEAANVKSDTDEYKAALEFAKQAQAFLALFPAARGTNVTRQTVRGLDPEAFRADLQAVLEGIGKVGGDIAASIGSAQQVADLKKRYEAADIDALSQRIDRGWTAISAILNACLGQNATLQTDSSQTINCDGPATVGLNAELSRKISDRQAILAEIARLTTDITALTKRRDAAQQIAATARSNQAALKQAAADLDKQLRAVQDVRDERTASANVLRGELETELSDPLAHPTLVEFAERASALRLDVTTALTTLKSVSTDVAALQTPLRLLTTAHSIQRQTVTVTVKAASKYEKFLDSATRAKRTEAVRTFAIVLDPYQPAHFSLAPAFVVGFVRNPEFTAVKDGTTYKIVKKEDDLNRYTLGVMLNITPDKWREPTFGGYFQVGLSPVKDAIGLFAGAGIRGQQIFSFGGGFMYQQVRALGGALSLDSRLNDPSELTIKREFKPGFYVHATVDIPK